VVKLGSKVRDAISGFEGVVVGKAVYLNGCHSACVEGPAKDGERKDLWFDEQRLETIEADAFKPQPSEATAGGPVHRNPPSM